MVYPLNAILIGCSAEQLPGVRQEFQELSVHVEGESPDVSGAIAGLRGGHGDKRLLVIHLESAQELGELRRLSASFAGWPILALLNPGADMQMMLVGAMRSGATQVVFLPIGRADFAEALDCIAGQFVYAEKVMNVIAVGGVTGGSGATTIAINLASEIASQLKKRCILVDLSLKIGVVASNLNVEPKATIHELLREVKRIDNLLLQRILTPVSENFQILAGPHKAIAGDAVVIEDVLLVIEALRQVTDYVVIDVPCTLDALYFEILAAASHAVLVAEQKVPSIRALKLIRDAIGRAEAGEAETLVINRYDPKMQGFGVKNLAQLLGVSGLTTIASDDAAALAAVNNGRPLRAVAPNSKALADIDALARSLVPPGEDAVPANKPESQGFFSRFRRSPITR